MLVSSTNEFQAFMFEQLHFLPEMNGNYTCYSDREHPEGGYCCIYCRERSEEHTSELQSH